MPRLKTPAALLGVALPLALVLPSGSTSVARPHPVSPHIQRISLQQLAPHTVGVAGPALRRTAVGLAATSTKPFTTLGVTWRHGSSAAERAVQVRFRSAGKWSSWQTLSDGEDDAPDAGTSDAVGQRDGTAPLWVGRSNGVQVRLTPGAPVPADLRVELVDPGTSAADAPARPVRGAAYADEPMPQIIPRSGWGADETLRTGNPSYSSTVKVGFVHHTETANGYSEAEAAGMIRSIYAYHVQSRGWDDIGYNFLVDRFGRVFEGRYGGITKAVIGAHTGGFNKDSFGTSLLGSYTSVAPPAATLASLERLFAWKLGSSYRDPLSTATLTSAGGGTARYSAGTQHTFAVVSGHRDAGYTACPGDATYARMDSIRSAVRSYLGAAFVDVSISTTTTYVGSGATVTVRARALMPMSWTLKVETAEGTPVRTDAGATEGDVSASWQLNDQLGLPVPPGRYTVRLEGTSLDGDVALPFTSVVDVRSPVIPKGAWMSPADFAQHPRQPSPSPSSSASPTPS